MMAGAAGVLVSGCGGALDPQGPHAAAIAQAWWVMAIGATLILAVVLALALYALLREPSRRPSLRARTLIVGGGLVFPTVVLAALLVYGTRVADRLLDGGDDALEILVTGQQWWWRAEYPEHGVATSNEIAVPVGRDVTIAIESADVIHSFWVPQLAGKTDLIPGRTNRVRLRADRPGTYLGQCAEFCGLLHAHMRFVVVALEPEAFAAWLAERAQPRTGLPPGQGTAAFLRHRCADCHALRGLAEPPTDRHGPDLTHYAARIAAREAPTAEGRAQLAVWLERRHMAELAPRHGPIEAPSRDEADALAALLEARR